MALGQLLLGQQSVNTGPWTDYDADTSHLTLLTDYDAAWWTALVAAGLSLAALWMFRIVKYGVVALCLWARGGHTDEEDHPTEPTSITEVLASSTGGRDLLSKSAVLLFQKRRRARNYWLLVILPLFFAVYVGWIIAGVYSVGIQLGREALWASDKCGVFRYDVANAGDEAALRAEIRDRDKEARAGEYAKRCYTPEDDTLLQSMGCNTFYRPAIPFTNTTSFQCPFRNPGICAPGAPAITFDTGRVAASYLGVNSVRKFQFRRSATCAPLIIDEPFVTSSSVNGTTTFFYHYGHIFDSPRPREYTFSSSGNPFDVHSSVYTMSMYGTSWYPELDYWAPLPDLWTPPGNTTLTIMFISGQHIVYRDASADPIFPADAKYIFDGDAQPWWYKSDPRFRVLACIDRHELCEEGVEDCWSMTADDDELPPSYMLMKLALEYSNINDAIARRLGSALIAQERVSQQYSSTLEEGHWKFEAERLFATSLARAQYQAWAIASAGDSNLEGYVDRTPRGAGDLCGIFKFKSMRHRNLDERMFWFLLAVPWIVLVLSLEVRGIWAVMKWIRERLPDMPWIASVFASGARGSRGAMKRVREQLQRLWKWASMGGTGEAATSAPPTASGSGDSGDDGEVSNDEQRAWEEEAGRTDEHTRLLGSRESHPRESHWAVLKNTVDDGIPLFWFLLLCFSKGVSWFFPARGRSG